MKAHKTTLSVRELQKTIGQWKSRKITDSTIAKLLELMLGMTAYMNEDAVYPVENFYDISKALKFKNARYLVEAVRPEGFLLRKKAWKPHGISFTSSTKIGWIRCGF